MWLVGRCGKIFYSADGGNTWEDHFVRGDARLYAVAFADQERGWIVGKNYDREQPRPLMMETLDGGRSWRELAVLPETTVIFSDIDVLMTPDGAVGWAVGDGGLLVRLVPRAS